MPRKVRAGVSLGHRNLCGRFPRPSATFAFNLTGRNRISAVSANQILRNGVLDWRRFRWTLLPRKSEIARPLVRKQSCVAFGQLTVFASRNLQFLSLTTLEFECHVIARRGGISSPETSFRFETIFDRSARC